MSEQLRVGVIGCGRMGGVPRPQLRAARLRPPGRGRRSRRGARAAARVGEAEVARVRRLARPDRVRRRRARRGLDRLRPPSMHAEVALEALAAGLHVLVEKPIATTLPDALRMRGAAMEADRKLMVGHVERFNPAVAKLRELVADGPPRHASTAPTRPGSVRCRRGSRTPASRSTSPPTTSTSCSTSSAVTIREIYADGGRFQHSSQEDLLTCLARFGDEERRHPRPARRQLADAGEEARDRPDRRERHAARQLHHPGRLVRRVADARRCTGTGSRCCAATARVPRCASRSPRPSRCGAELEAFCRCVLDDTPEPVSAHDGVKALAAALGDARVGGRPPAGRAARHPRARDRWR